MITYAATFLAVDICEERFILLISSLVTPYIPATSLIILSTVTGAMESSLRISLMAFIAWVIVGGVPIRCCEALSFLTQPSSCLMSALSLVAIVSTTSFVRVRFKRSAFRLIMATLVSKSGGVMSAIRPHSNLVLILSSRVLMSLGGLSEVRIICLP